MRQELQNIEYIERYLENSLSPSDKRKFEQHLKEDAQFRAAVNLQRQLIEQVKEQAFLQDIAQHHRDFLAQEKQSTSGFGWALPIGGLLLLALVGAWWYQQSNAAPVPPPLSEQVVEETPELPVEELRQAPQQLAPALQTPYLVQQLSANRTATFAFKGSPSTLTIPKGALVNAAGEVVRGTYELQYRALNHPAAMATAGFPLLSTGENAQGIASVGAFEIRAFQKGEPLFVAPGKELSLDYELQERVHQATLYHLDEENTTWEASEQALVLPKRGAYDKVVDSVAFQEATRLYKASLKAANPEQPQRRKDTLDAGTITMMPKRLEKLSDATPPQPNQYLVRHYKNPKLVKALRLGSFGVYNCGKPYQVKNQVVIAGKYSNLQKEMIQNARTLSVIDMDYKAAYSFQADQFICNSQANNVFLLWTKEGGLYAFVKKAALDLQTGTYSFQMENLSELVHNSKDLKAYLARLQAKIDKKG